MTFNQLWSLVEGQIQLRHSFHDAVAFCEKKKSFPGHIFHMFEMWYAFSRGLFKRQGLSNISQVYKYVQIYNIINQIQKGRRCAVVKSCSEPITAQKPKTVIRQVMMFWDEN